MADLRFVAVQARFQLIALARNRRAVVLGLVLPVVLLVMFNSVFVPHDDTVDVAGARVGAHAYFTAAMLAYAILGSAFNQLGIGLVSQREGGQLKRLRGTPVPAWTFVVATVLRVVTSVAVMSVVLLAIGRFAYDVPISAEALAEIALYVVLGTASLCGVGIAATSPTSRARARRCPSPPSCSRSSRAFSCPSTSSPAGSRRSAASCPSTTSPPGCRPRSGPPATRR